MQLFLRLVLRSLSRHKKKGTRLFLLICLCVAAMIFSLAMCDSFYKQYLTQGIGSFTGHLAIVSPENGKVTGLNLGLESDELPLIKISKELENMVKSNPYVEASGAVIETGGPFYTVDGDNQSGSGIAAIDPDVFEKLFPKVTLIEGSNDFTYRGEKDIPILRRGFWPGERQVEGNKTFSRKDFRLTDSKLEPFKQQVKKDFPALFADSDITGEKGTDLFITAMTESLSQRVLYKTIPGSYLNDYNWEIDDVVFEIKNLGPEKTEKDADKLARLNKKLFHALYPDSTAPVPQELQLDVSMTLMVPQASSSEVISMPIVLPIKFVGIAETMPLYYNTSYIDRAVLLNYMDLENDAATEYVIRLKDKKYTPQVKEEIRAFLKQNNLDYRVLDYKELGKIYIPTAVAFQVILMILCILFGVTIIIFIVNMIMLSIVKRKKEIGTSIAIGMSKEQNMLIFLGEVAVLISFAWLAGALLGNILIGIFAYVGLPGMIFFTGGRLFFLMDIKYSLIIYLFLLPAGLLAAFIPVLSINKLRIVEILREKN